MVINGGAVSSVFGRIGAVVAAAGDYTAAQVTNALDLSKVTLQTMSGALALKALTAINQDPNLVFALSGGGQRGLQIDDGASSGANPLFWVTQGGSTVRFSVSAGGNGVLSGNLQLGGASTLFSGSGAPGAGTGSNGDYYFRSDTPGTANQRIYVKSAGAWVGVV